jgi:hypothetical protein
MFFTFCGRLIPPPPEKTLVRRLFRCAVANRKHKPRRDDDRSSIVRAAGDCHPGSSKAAANAEDLPNRTVPSAEANWPRIAF